MIHLRLIVSLYKIQNIMKTRRGGEMQKQDDHARRREDYEESGVKRNPYLVNYEVRRSRQGRNRQPYGKVASGQDSGAMSFYEYDSGEEGLPDKRRTSAGKEGLVRRNLSVREKTPAGRRTSSGEEAQIYGHMFAEEINDCSRDPYDDEPFGRSGRVRGGKEEADLDIIGLEEAVVPRPVHRGPDIAVYGDNFGHNSGRESDHRTAPYREKSGRRLKGIPNWQGGAYGENPGATSSRRSGAYGENPGATSSRRSAAYGENLGAASARGNGTYRESSACGRVSGSGSRPVVYENPGRSSGTASYRESPARRRAGERDSRNRKYTKTAGTRPGQVSQSRQAFQARTEGRSAGRRANARRRKRVMMQRLMVGVWILCIIALGTVFVIRNYRVAAAEGTGENKSGLFAGAAGGTMGQQASGKFVQGLPAEVYAKHPDWEENFLTLNEYSRPGEPLETITNIFVHYTANPGTSAAQNRSYFEQQKDTHEVSVSAHFIIGYDGEIIQCVPLDEIAYAVMTRNYDSVSIECCYKAQDGSFTQETYDSLISLLA